MRLAVLNSRVHAFDKIECGGGSMSSQFEEKSDFDYFLDGLSILMVIILIVLALPIGLFVAAYLGLLKQLFFR